MLALITGLALVNQTTVTLAAVGDVMLGRWVGKRLARQGTGRMLAEVHSAFAHADLVVGNLECALTLHPMVGQKQIQLRGNPRFIGALKGFTLLSLVNNHAGDAGPDGLADAAKTLRSAGIHPLEPGPKPEYVTRKGIRFGFIGMSDLPGFRPPAGWRDVVLGARAKCDVLIVCMHWGVEGLSVTSPSQSRMATALAGLGVDAVLGCHPHVLEPIAWLPGSKDRRCLVAYSLGNFVFDAKPGPDSKTEILPLTVDRRGVTGYRVTPCHIVSSFPKLG